MTEKKEQIELGGKVPERQYPIDTTEVEEEYQKLAAKMNFGGSKYLPRIIKKALSLEQGKVALELYISMEEVARLLGITEEDVAKDPQGYQLRAIAKKLDISENKINEYIQYMFELGFAFPTRKGWRFARTIVQMKDSMTNPKYDKQLGDEFFDLWEAVQRLETYPTRYLWNYYIESSETGPMFRVIPARKSLKDIPVEERVPEDDIERVFKLYATAAVEHCPCKRLIRDRACKSPTEVCLIFDRIAEHNIRRKAAHVVSAEEAIKIHDAATDLGLVCIPQSNEAKPTRLSMICHCHWCCCDVLAPPIMMNMPLKQIIAPSCYQAVVEPEKCTGCQLCLTRCQFGAIEMKKYIGQGRQEKMKAWVDSEKCMGCGLCVISCPADARTMKMVRSAESIPKERPSSFYTGVPDSRQGKHLDTGSVMTRPVQ
jgi:NAD-dependent dihydropyrimidine dehydrogenase PreA subunit/biotin operon repressor